MDRKIVLHILAGLIFFGACSLAFANPAPQASSHDDMDYMQNDDEYDYSDDESAPNSHTRPTANSTSGLEPYFDKNDVTVSTIVGQNATLRCPAKNLSENNVILWYKDGNLLSNDKLVLKPGYALNHANFDLTVINATEPSQGEYICEVQPQKVVLHTTLIVSEHPIEAILSESSTSSQESLHLRTTSLLTTSVIGIFLFLRI